MKSKEQGLRFKVYHNQMLDNGTIPEKTTLDQYGREFNNGKPTGQVGWANH